MTETTADRTKTSETENHIAKPARAELNSLLHQRLADLVNLQIQLKQAHWSLRDRPLIGLDELLDKVAEEIESYVDMAAERIMQRGGIGKVTMRAAAARSKLEEYSGTFVNGAAHVQAFTKALSAFEREARNSIDEANALDDADAADIFTGISRAADKWPWFAKALLECN